MNESDLLLVTGATGLVGSHVVEQARDRGIRTRALVRPSADASLLEGWGAELCRGDMTDAASLNTAVDAVTVIVHCAAKVGDWGPTDAYRQVNVRGVCDLMDAAQKSNNLKRFVQISSLGVYPARDHYGTDETEPPNTKGIDGYTLTKVESEQQVMQRAVDDGFPAVVLRPGFIYGPRDRTVLPRLIERLRSGGFAFLGSTDKLMNNTFVGNLCQAVFAAIERDNVIGRAYNIRDGRAVTKKEFIETICASAGYDMPTKVVPLPVARVLAAGLESLWKLLRREEAPILSSARIKFLGLNLDFSIDRAGRELDYDPAADFADAMKDTVTWFRENSLT